MKGLFFAVLVAVALAGCGVEWFPTPTATPVTANGLTITTTTLPAGAVGAAYSQTLAATGGTTPYTWKVASGTLPAGLTLSTAGVLSGTPTTAGTSSFTVQVTDSSSTALTSTQALTLQVSQAAARLASEPAAAASEESGMVPGTTATTNGTTIMVNGANDSVTTSGGTAVTVPASAPATGTAENTGSAQ